MSELATKYRRMDALIQRRYEDGQVRDAVLSLSYWLKIASMQGYPEVEDIAAVLALCEPLETTCGLRKAYLQIATLVYAKHDLQAALEVAEDARRLYPDDERLEKMAGKIREAKRRGQS